MDEQEQYVPSESIRQIVHLLASTEMTVADIAERMSCSKNTIAAINRKFQVRLYKRLRTHWSKTKTDTRSVDSISQPSEN
jgi:DNA-binding CsgD family transcriptional regulator